MWNIILDWLDFTWKTKTAKDLWKQCNLQVVTSDKLKDMLQEVSINDWEYVLKYLSSYNNTVFDRHLLSILSYWKINQKDIFSKVIDIKEVLTKLIEQNSKSIFVLRFKKYSLLEKSIYKNINIKYSNVSEHDKKLLDLDYFSFYLSNYKYFFKLLEEINENMSYKYKWIIIKQNLNYENYERLYNEILRACENINNIN